MFLKCAFMGTIMPVEAFFNQLVEVVVRFSRCITHVDNVWLHVVPSSLPASLVLGLGLVRMWIAPCGLRGMVRS